MKMNDILAALDELFPDAGCELEHRNHFEMAVAVILSAQTTDVSVNRVMPGLMAKYPDAESLAAGDLKDIEQCIASLGLYRNKAKSIKGMAAALVERFDGEVPSTMEELVTLPGVGRKCANVILSECFGIPALAVDTHIYRIARRLGITKPDDTVYETEMKLCRRIPKERWTKTHHQMIFFGRYLCHARNPECDRCPLVSGCKEKNKHFAGEKKK